jgi:iron complex transport system substrate-binding protein
MEAFMRTLVHTLMGLIPVFVSQFSVAAHYPVTVESCNREVTFNQAPARAVSQDVNLTSIMVALGLQDHMVGYTGVTGWNKPSPQLVEALKGLPELATHYPSVETLLQANADFYFAGWNYGMRVGGDVTPQTLAPLGIQVYELSESCAQIMPRPAVSLNELYRDIENLGKIFNVSDRADALVASLQVRQREVSTAVQGKRRLRVFLYDSGEDRPFTAGRLAIPQALIDAAGGSNVMQDVQASWTQVGWESVVEADPDVILIVDYGQKSAAQKQQFLVDNPALQSVGAVRNKRFVVLPYSAVTPGVENIEAIETLAGALSQWR